MEDLEEIKRKLVKTELAKKHQETIRDIRNRIIEQALLDAELDNINTLDKNFHLDTTAIMREIAETNWPSDIPDNYSLVKVAIKLKTMHQCKECLKYGLESLFQKYEDDLCTQCEEEEHDEKHRLLREQQQNEIVACQECKEWYPRHQLQTNPHYMTSSNVYCQKCLDKILSLFQRVCAICDIHYVAIDHEETFDLCHKCRTPPLVREGARVRTHNYRASSMDLVATLTYKQWITVLNFFNWKCAYCLRTFKGLEHYIPLGMNGSGTTANNCLPSCKRCNTRKRDKHPDDFERLFPTDNIARIKVYFAGLAEHL